MKIFRIRNTAKTNSTGKKMNMNKTRFLIFTLFVLIAVSSTAVFSATTSASSLDKFFENNLPAPIASSLTSINNAVFGTASVPNASQVVTADELAPAPTVMTDKDDYQPGETAIITGSGFIYTDAEGNPVVETSVTLQVLHADGTPNTGNGHDVSTISVNGDGTFTTQWYVDPDDSLGAIFRVTAIGQDSGLKAERIFTDGFLVACNNISGSFESLASGSSTWTSASAAGWKELENVPIRVALTSSCASAATPIEQNVQVQFDHHAGQTPGIQDLIDFVPSTGVGIITTPLLDSPANGVWSYTFKIRLTASTGNVQFKAPLSAGSHNFTGNSLQLKGSSVFSLGTMGISKPGALPGFPDLALTKSGPDNAAPGQTVTYTLNYQNKSTAANAATGVQLIDTLPSSVTYVPNSCVGCSVAGNTITWNLGSLPIGATGSKSLQATMPTVTTTQTIINSAELFLAENDITPTDNRATKATVVSRSVIAPSITTQPQSAEKCEGDSVTFSVVASGTSPTYQWFKGGTSAANAISGAADSSYSISSVAAANAGDYYVKVSNSAGTATSNAAALAVNTPPSITAQPQGAANAFGEYVTFSVTANGTNPTYQWYKGDPTVTANVINGATLSSYTISSVAAANAGDYYVVVNGTCSPAVTSSKATLAVNKATATVSLNNPTFTYDGTAKSAAATTNPTGLTVDLVYSQNNTPVAAPTNTGDYMVTATINDTNYQGSTTGTLKINKAAVTATAGSGTATYDGSAKSPSACVVSGALPGAFKGDLSCANDPISVGPAAGTTTIKPVVSGTGLTNFDITKEDGTAVISKATSATVITCPVSIGYNGAAQTPCTATVTGAGGLNESVAVTHTDNVNAGTATANAAYTESTNYTGSIAEAKTFTISKAAVTATAGGLSGTYNGAAQSPLACVVSGAFKGDLSCANDPISVGPGVSTTIIKPVVSGTGLTNFDITKEDGTAVISKATSATVITCPVSVIYDGSAQTPCSVSITGAGGLSLTPTAAYSNNTNAGTATASYEFAGDDNYKGSTGSKTFTIGKAGSITTVTCSDIVGYNTAAQTPCTAAVTGVGGLNQQVAVTYSNNTNVGTATASATYGGDDNHTGSTGSKTFTIVARSSVVSYIGQTQWTTSGSSSTTAQITLSASVKDPTGLGLVGAKAEFIDVTTPSSPKVLASNVNVSPVANSSSDTGTVNTIVTLSSGQYGADSYRILVRLTGNYTNEDQAQLDKSAWVSVSKPAATNETIGVGIMTVTAGQNAAGVYGDYRGNAPINFTVGMTYNKSVTNLQGKITLAVPQADGGTAYIKSNSISSMTVTTVGGVKKSTIYAKCSVTKMLANGTSVAGEGNVSLRMDINDNGNTSGVDDVGFTVLSSSNSQLFYSNNWMLDPATNAWRTVLQRITSGNVTVN